MAEQKAEPNLSVTTEELRKRIMQQCDEMRERFPHFRKMAMFPWLGKMFGKSSTRILILGESTYIDPKPTIMGVSIQAKTIEIAEVGKFQIPRLLVDSDSGKQSRNTGNFIRNITTYLTGYNKLSGKDFVDAWENWGFSQLVQKILQDKRARPLREDWEQGWQALPS